MKKIRIVSKEMMLQHINATTPYAIVADAPTIASNSVSYSDIFKSLRINDSSNVEKIMLGIPLGKLFPGDKVTVHFECMNVSGEAMKVAIDYHEKHDYTDANFTTLASISTPKTNTFETFYNTFVITEEKFCKLAIGTFSTGVGDNYARNVEVYVNGYKQDVSFMSFESSLNFDSRIGDIMYNQDCYYQVTDGLCKFFFNFDVTSFSVTQGFATHIKLPFHSAKSYVNGSVYVYNTVDSINIMQPLSLTANTQFAYLRTPNVISDKFKVGTKLYGFVEFPI